MEHSGFRLVLLKYIPVCWFYSMQTSGTTSYEIAGVLAECFFVLRKGWTVTRFERFWTLSRPWRLKRSLWEYVSIYGIFTRKAHLLGFLVIYVVLLQTSGTTRMQVLNMGLSQKWSFAKYLCQQPPSSAFLQCIPACSIYSGIVEQGLLLDLWRRVILKVCGGGIVSYI